MAFFKNSKTNEQTRLRVEQDFQPTYDKLVARQTALEVERDTLSNQINNFGDVVRLERINYSEKHGRKFQYLNATTQDPSFSFSYLDVLGRKGWELIAVDSYSIGGTTLMGDTKMTVHSQFFFKREILDLPENELAKLGLDREENIRRLPHVERELKKILEYKEILKAKVEQIGNGAIKFLKENDELENQPLN